MRKIEKNFTPLTIVSDKVNEDFNKNIAAKLYVGKDRYKDIQDDLNTLYHNKCAYCEKDLSDTDKPVEHYRPKKERKERNSKKIHNGYYWLAYSWNNLLLACTQCNRHKSTFFDIQQPQSEYRGETLQELQYKDYAGEKPLLINPEQITENDLNNQFTFAIDGEIKGLTPNMVYTINICDLNREELKNNKRLVLLNSYLNRYKRQIIKPNADTTKILADIVEELTTETTEKSEFTAWRKFMIKFFSDKLHATTI